MEVIRTLLCVLFLTVFETLVYATNEEKRILMDGEPVIDLQGEIDQLRAQLMAQQKVINGIGSSYIRWGRNTCPPTATLVYKGYTAGKKVNEPGSGTDNVCLPADPTWSNYVDGFSSFPKAYIYGTEIDIDDNEHIFNYPAHQQDVPCAICWTNKTHSLMIPGRNNCYTNWQKEYDGYLMGAAHIYNAYSHVCVDGNPEFLQHGNTNDNQHILYFVEAQCGSLPCPPYVAGRELACVVCSR